jgi:hypothetical protein
MHMGLNSSKNARLTREQCSKGSFRLFTDTLRLLRHAQQTQPEPCMAKYIVGIARGFLLLCSMAFAIHGLAVSEPLAPWLSASRELHIIVIAVTGNLIFLAFPFRRRSDMALALAILLSAMDVAGRVSPSLGLADVAGLALVILPVWIERLRSRGRHERRRRAAWRDVIGVRPRRDNERHHILIGSD